jgi:hypothetical protein
MARVGRRCSLGKAVETTSSGEEGDGEGEDFETWFAFFRLLTIVATV